MIPRIIHYCWFGKKKLPKEFQGYIDGWKKLCPDFEIREWNEKNLDINKSRYAREAYRAGKWAFVSDYARFRILYEYGGIYLDTDVELIKPLEELLKTCDENGITGFMGIERPETGDIAPGLITAATPHNPIIKDLLLGYKDRHFNLENGLKNLTSVVEYTTQYFNKQTHKLVQGKCINEINKDDGVIDFPIKDRGLREAALDSIGQQDETSNNNRDENEIGTKSFRIYPAEYFNPMDMSTGKITITENTYSIHHYASSWVDGYSKLRGKIYKGIRRVFGKNTAEKVRSVIGKR